MKSHKTSNHYYINIKLYHKAINTEVNKFYQKIRQLREKKTINRDAKAIVTKWKIDNRIPKLHKQEFITIKNHKENFLNNPQY